MRRPLPTKLDAVLGKLIVLWDFALLSCYTAAMDERHVVVAGGGAAGFFAAIACAEASPGARVIILEKGSHFLSKVRISGGGRCNVTHACFDPRELSSFYPRGGSALRGPFTTFQPRDTIDWFEQRGVALKTEPDGRVFPVSDSSLSIVNCLLQTANAAGVEVMPNVGVDRAFRSAEKGFELTLTDGRAVTQRPTPACHWRLPGLGCRSTAGLSGTLLGSASPLPLFVSNCLVLAEESGRHFPELCRSRGAWSALAPARCHPHHPCWRQRTSHSPALGLGGSRVARR